MSDPEQRAQLTGKVLSDATRLSSKKMAGRLRSNEKLAQDARMVGRTLEIHAVMKVVGVVFGCGGLAIAAIVLGPLLGWGLNAPLVVVVALAGAAIGWVLPDMFLRTAANKERDMFQQVGEAWLELVAQLATAGVDTFAALGLAATYSDQPGFVLIRESLSRAAISGDPPWTAMHALIEERGLIFLEPFAAALELSRHHRGRVSQGDPHTGAVHPRQGAARSRRRGCLGGREGGRAAGADQRRFHGADGLSAR